MNRSTKQVCGSSDHACTAPNSNNFALWKSGKHQLHAKLILASSATFQFKGTEVINQNHMTCIISVCQPKYLKLLIKKKLANKNTKYPKHKSFTKVYMYLPPNFTQCFQTEKEVKHWYILFSTIKRHTERQRSKNVYISSNINLHAALSER